MNSDADNSGFVCKDGCIMILQQIGYQEKTNSLSMSCDIYYIRCSKALYNLLPGKSFSCGSMNPPKNFPISS